MTRKNLLSLTALFQGALYIYRDMMQFGTWTLDGMHFFLQRLLNYFFRNNWETFENRRD